MAIDSASKLILTHHNGRRDASSTRYFVSKLRDAIAGNCHVTTDGFRPYHTSVPAALWDKQITYARLIKIFGSNQPREESRYSPAPIKGILKEKVFGYCEDDQICTSHIERFNLSLRMGLRRFTRLTNAHSKSHRHHDAAIALWICFYNYCRVHSTLKSTPAVAAKLTDATWAIERLLDELSTL